MPTTSQIRKPSPLASTTVRQHIVRGILGLVLFAAAIAGAAIVSPAALVLTIPGFVSLRGCPTCWAVGLMQTRQHEQAQRACAIPRSG